MSDSYVIRARIVAEDATTAGVTAASKHLTELEEKGRVVGRSIAASLSRAFQTAGTGSVRVQRQIRDVEETGRTAGTNLSSWFGRAFAVLGGTAAIGGMARGLVGINSEIEQATSGLAGLFTAQTGLPIVQSLQVARGELRYLRQDAAKGVGELSDYLATYQGIVGVALPLGASTEQMRALTRNSLAAGFAMQGNRGLQNAPLDVQQAMSGMVGDRTTPIVMAALRASGMSAEAFRALKPEERIDALNKAFGKFAPAVELMGKSWSAQFSTLKDNVTELLRTVTRPLFDRWSGYLRDANAWLDKNRDNLTQIAEVWGARLVRMWDTLIRQAKTYAVIVAGTALVQYGAPVGRGASAVAGGLGRAAGVVREGFAGVSLRDPFGMASIFGGNLLGAGGGAASGGILASLRGLFGVIGRAAGPIAIVTTALLALKGGLEEYPGVLLFIKDQAAALWGSLGRLGDALGTLTSKGSALNLVGAALGYTFGGVLWTIDKLVVGVGTLAVVLGTLLQVIGDGYKAIYYASQGDFAAASKIDLAGRVTAAQDQLSELWFGSHNNGVQGDQTAPDGKLPKLPPVANNVTNINGPVTLQVKTEINADPARVMVALDEGVDKLRLFRRQAKRLPAFGV